MNENINLTEILKNCPKGTKLYSPIFGEVSLINSNAKFPYPIVVRINNNLEESFTVEGKLLIDYKDAECVLFPSKDQKDWSKFTAPLYKNEQKSTNKIKPRFNVGDWIIYIKSKSIYQVEKKENYEYTLRYILGGSLCLPFSNEELIREWNIQDAKDGDILVCNKEILIFKSYSVITNLIYFYCWYDEHTNNFHSKEVIDILSTTRDNIYPATKEQRDLLFQKIKEAGYKWNAETKTLENLIKPKFKVGDKIKHKETNNVYEILKVYDNSYGIAGFNWGILIKYQDEYELVNNKFDPKILKPFDKVLVRDNYKECWLCMFFSHIVDGIHIYKYITIGSAFKYCIPYNDDTKHLVGTTEEAPNFYKY